MYWPGTVIMLTQNKKNVGPTAHLTLAEHTPARAEVEALVRAEFSISRMSHQGQDAPRYLPFDQLGGVRDNREFKRRAIHLATEYVSLLVLQDELRQQWRSHPAEDKTQSTLTTCHPPLQLVNQDTLNREFSIWNLHVKQVIESFPEVVAQYEQARTAAWHSPSLTGAAHDANPTALPWRESLHGAIVSLALETKVRITGVPKIPKAAALLGNDIPPTLGVAKAAEFAAKAARCWPPSPTKHIALNSWVRSELEALTAALPRRANYALRNNDDVD